MQSAATPLDGGTFVQKMVHARGTEGTRGSYRKHGKENDLTIPSFRDLAQLLKMLTENLRF
jgi:hypothetical protein